MKQYEIRWAELPRPIGRRPVFLLSRPAAYKYLNKILVAEVTTSIRDIPLEIALGAAEGLSEPCVANLDNIHVVPKAAIRERAGRLAPNREAQVKRALGYVLGWPELKVL